MTCKIPNCDNEEMAEGYGICVECARNTVARMLHVSGTRPLSATYPHTEAEKAEGLYWLRHIIANIDDIVAKEQQVIDKYGKDYNRDSETPWIRIKK